MEQLIKADDFLSDAPPERIMGSECEYNVQSKGVGFDEPLYRYLDGANLRRINLKSVQNNEFLSNGARLYKDIHYIEYSSAESLGPVEATAADFAGARILQRMITKSDLPYNGVFRNSGLFLPSPNKRNGQLTEFSAVTSGYHQNFIYPSTIRNNSLFHTIITAHLTSRVWSMNGIIRPQGYGLSQKVFDIGGHPLNRSTGRRTKEHDKPMYMQHRNDRDVAGGAEWARVEVRYADPAHSPLALYLGFASTSLVLRVAEHSNLFTSYDETELMLHRPAVAAHRFSNDAGFRKTAENMAGKRLTALNLGEIVLDKVRVVAEHIDIPESERMAIDLWQDVIDRLYESDFESGSYAGLDTMLDIAARHKLLLNNFGDPLSWARNAKAIRASIGYDMIAPKYPTATYWNNIPQTIVSEDLVDKFTKTAPQTRAARRAWVIRNRATNVRFMNWSQIMYQDAQPTEFLHNPYLTTRQTTAPIRNEM